VGVVLDCSCPPLVLSPCSFRFTALAGRHFCCPSLPLALLAKSVQVSTRLLLVLPDYLLLSFFLSLLGEI
jgi:hypothetical protein